MKTYLKNIIVILGILVMSSSCEDFLDVRPKGEVPGKDLFKDQKGFENALYGVYAKMRNTSSYGHTLTYHGLDIMGAYYTCYGNTYITELRMFNYKQPDVEKEFYNVWCNLYNNISNVNNVLKNLKDQSSGTLKYYDIYKGEALGLRAFMHFDLLRIFSNQITIDAGAAGIPYATDFSLVTPDVLTAAQVYTRIKADLKEAEKLLNNPKLYADGVGYEKFLNDQSTHFNLQAVQATLARVYLTENKPDSALYYAKLVIGSGKHSLLDKTRIEGAFAGILSQKETIFGIYFKEFYDQVYKDLQQSISFASLDPRYNIEAIYAKNRVGNDFRWSAWFQTQNKKLRMVKITDLYKLNNQECPANVIQGINLIRLPEMYYIVAEVFLQKGQTGEALSYFNAVLESRGLIALDKRVPEESLTLERIDEERYKELIGEGQSFFNMKRRNQNFQNADGQTITASPAVYTVPIPEQEFDYRN